MLRIGILGTADVAYKRFLPALAGCKDVVCAGIAPFNDSDGGERLARFSSSYALNTYADYDSLIAAENLDAVYIPTPPATHYEWAKKALLAGKHCLVEKPLTCSPKQSQELIELAAQQNLAIYENFMFVHHAQIKAVQEWLAAGRLGALRHLALYFGFPLRAPDDFRYNKELGGGARLDTAGYLLKLATLLMDEPELKAAQLNFTPLAKVDMYGSLMLVDRNGLVLQGSFGMDNYYRCELDIWGQNGILQSDRVFTAPPGFEPVYKLYTAGGCEELRLASDDHFQHSIEHFHHLVLGQADREAETRSIMQCSQLLQRLLELSA